MNELTKFLIEELLDESKTVALYGGGFKPPTKGHFNVVELALNELPDISELKVLVGQGVRDGITQEESLAVWNIYKNYLSPKVVIEPSIAPVKSVLNYAKDNPDTKVYWILGARDGEEGDLEDIARRTKTISKYPNLEVKVITNSGGVSGTKARKAVKDNNKEQFLEFIPDIKEKEQIWDIVHPVVKEGFIDDIKTKLKEFEGDSNPLKLPYIDTWHNGQYKAQNDETEEAIKLMTKAAEEAEKYAEEKNDGGVAGEAGYYRGTIAWLKKDYNTVEKYINDKYVKITGNDEVLERLLKNKDKSYKEAYNINEEITPDQLKQADTYADKQLAPVDVDLTSKHILDRLTSRDSDVTLAQLIGFFKRLGQNKKEFFDFFKKYKEIVATDKRTNLNIPFLNMTNKVIAKTIMRKDNFMSSSPKLVFEVGEANLKPYKWEEADIEGWVTYVEFTTESETEYNVDIATVPYFDNDLNNYKALEIEFLAKPKDAQGSSAKIVVNKGELYRVMATITDIVKYYAKKFKAKAISYSPSKKSDEEDFGSQRDNLYRAFISKAIPGVRFEKSSNFITAILPDKTLNEADPEKGTGKKPKGSSRRLYTDEDPKDTVSIKFKTKEDIVDTLNKTSFKAKSHARQSQIINVVHQRVRAAYSKAKDPEVKSRLKRALDYIEKRKEMSKKKTERLNKENVAPNHNGRSGRYGSGYTPVKENDQELDKQINTILQDWIISSLDDKEKRSFTLQKLLQLDIPEEYKQVPSNTMFRIIRAEPGLTKIKLDKTPYSSYAYDYKGVKKILSWYKKDYNDKLTSYLVEISVKDVIISIPTFYKKTKIWNGKYFDRLWRTEYEVIAKNPSGEYEVEILQELVTATQVICDNCGWEWKIEDGGKDLYICHKCGHNNTPNKLNEGRYDSITNQLSRLAFKAFKDIYDNGDKKGKFSFTVGPDDEDIQSDEFELDFTGVVEITDDEYMVDGGANEGFDDKGDEITPLIVLKFKIPQDPDWQKVSFDIKDVVRHELEHLTQDGLNLKGYVGIDDPRAQNDPKLTRPGKYMQNDQFIRNMIDSDSLPKVNYFRLEKEVDAMLQGMYFKAKKSRTPFKDVINDYFEKVGLEGEDKQDILDLWTKRLKALNLPAIQETDMFGLNELAKTFVKETFEKTWNLQDGMLSLSKYMIDNGMNIKPLPKIKVIKDDEENASHLLGKTAYYDPNSKSITLYTMNRHPKDVLRSFAHEMVHHEQNLEGRLNNINTTNTNKDGDLPEIEKEAYEKGNMMLRNWEDSIKNV